jgi:integrase
MSLYLTQFQRKDGKISAIWRYDFEKGGKRYAGSLGQVSEAEAQMRYATLKGLVEEAIFREKETALRLKLGLAPSFEAFANRFVEYYRANTRPSTVQAVDNCVKQFLPTLGRKRLSDVTPEDVDAFKKDARARGWSPFTINRRVGILKTLFTRAVEWGELPKSPIQRVKKLKVLAKHHRVLTPEEETQLLNTCNPQLRVVVFAALLTGMRRSELTTLVWRDVHWDAGLIRIRAEVTKTGRERHVPLSDTLEAVLRPLQGGADDRVFGYRDFGKSYQRAVRKSGIAHCRFHDLRHTFATRLLNKGVDLRTVQELLGHTSLTMIQAYTHPDHAHLRQAIARLDAAVTLPVDGKPSAQSVEAILQGLARLGVVELSGGAKMAS